MEQTSLFDSTFNARDVAADGYKAMVEGKLNELAGVTLGQRMMMKTAPLMPKRLMLRQIRQMQEVPA
jgi:hypothetical protein